MLDWEGSKLQRQLINREFKNLFDVIRGGGGGRRGTKTVNVPFLIIQRALKVPFFVPGVNTTL